MGSYKIIFIVTERADKDSYKLFRFTLTVKANQTFIGNPNNSDDGDDIYAKYRNAKFNKTIEAYISEITIYGVVKVVFNDSLVIPSKVAAL